MNDVMALVTEIELYYDGYISIKIYTDFSGCLMCGDQELIVFDEESDNCSHIIESLEKHLLKLKRDM